MYRSRKAKIVATLGPSSGSLEMVEALFLAGVDVFRLNFSHGSHEDHRRFASFIRETEEKHHRSIAILADLQGPKLRIGRFLDQKVYLVSGQTFCLDLDPELGNENRVQLPHPELFPVLTPGTAILLDDGKLSLIVTHIKENMIETVVTAGGALSNNKGVNVPSVQLPISALSPKDRADLAFALDLGVDWVALSFVQRPEDILETRALMNGRARLASKIEKPMALDHLDEIIALSDAVMVARGDLGVEVSPEMVPAIQKQIIRKCRQQGRPVIVATQMLDSMVTSPAPTRAEASDVATAVYDGVDAVMLSAESASGEYPEEAVTMMDRIIQNVEQDEHYHKIMASTRPAPVGNINDALTAAAREVANIIPLKLIVTFTESGDTAFREARERPEATIIGLTPSIGTARLLNLLWGTHPVLSPVISSFNEMITTGCTMVQQEQLAGNGDHVAILAGVPFGGKGGTNILHVVKLGAKQERQDA